MSARHVIPLPADLPLGTPTCRWTEAQLARRRAVVRFFIYRLHAEDGTVLYVGRSCDVPNRLRGHYAEATHRNRNHPVVARKRAWFFKVRSVSMVGPFNLDDANEREWDEIHELQPVGNIAGTLRDPHRPRRLAALDPSP